MMNPRVFSNLLFSVPLVAAATLSSVQTEAAPAAPAAILKGTNSCYALKLPGNMVDSNACDSVIFVVAHVDCDDHKVVETERVKGKLSECSDTSATAQLELGQDNFKLQLNKRQDASYDIWDIARPGAKKAAVVSTRGATLKNTPPPAAPIAAGATNSRRIDINAYLDAMGSVAIARNFTSPAASALSARATREASYSRTRIGVDSALLRASLAKSDWLFLIDFAAGDLVPLWTATPTEVDTYGSRVSITQAFAERKLNEKTFVKAGLLDHPLGSSEKIRFFAPAVSYSYTELYGQPHILSGASVDRDLTTRVRGQAFVGSGWNRTGALENSWSTGAGITMNQEKWSGSFNVITSNEPGLDSNAKITAFNAEAKITRETSAWNARLSWGTMSEKRFGLASDVAWVGLLAGQTKKIDDIKSWGWRAEFFQNTDGIIIGRPGWDKMAAANGFYFWRIDEDVRLGAELQFEMSPADSTHMNLRGGALLSWKI